MAISGVTSSDPTTNAASTSSSAAAKKSALDKDSFLKLLVAQISHQDPLKPMEGTEFVTQLSQFAIVEQAIAQSAKLDSLGLQMQGLGNASTTELVGKTVTIKGKGIAYDGVTATSSSVTLGGAADKVTVRIKDAEGHTVRTLEMNKQPAGPLSVTWDGKDDAGNAAPSGSYTMSVDAHAADGTAVAVDQAVSGRVTKVSFEKGYPELSLDSGVSAPVSDLVSVDGPPPVSSASK